jgi:exonuclease SbcC
MKILAIRLKNLASIAGPVEIDLTTEPLASAGLFAITGPTGAGKSTLLDALCLALFGAVPRLGDTGQAKMPDADTDISIGDPRTLIRRGTGGGYAEVDFIGVSGRRYRARWEANRARDKAGGKLQNSRQSLYDLDAEQLLASQKTEYKAQLELALGLNFEQFTRAVLLAQSEFSAFLKANDNERSELLEKLTDTALYTQLGRRAYDRAKEAKEALRALQDQAVGITPLDAEARALLDEQTAAAQAQLKALQAQLKQLELQRTWLKELLEWQARQHAALEQLRQAEQTWHAQAGQRLDLSRLEQLLPQRHHFARQADLRAQLPPLAARIREQLDQQATLQSRHSALHQQQTQLHDSLNEALKQQAEAVPVLREAFAAQNTLDRLSREREQRREQARQSESACAEGQAELVGLHTRQQEVATRLQQLATQLGNSQALASLSDAWGAYREQLQQLMLTANRLDQGQAELPQLQQRSQAAEAHWHEQRQALELLYSEAAAEPHAVAEQIRLLDGLAKDNRKRQRGLEDLARLWANHQQLDQQRQALSARQAEARQRHEQLKHTGLRVKVELTAAEQALQVTRQLLERQRLARGESVEALRAQLRDDQPCPVCGSQEHPYHQPEALLESLGRHDQEEEATARHAVDALNGRLVELRGELGGVIAQQKEFFNQQEQLTAQLQALLPTLEGHPLAASLLALSDERRSAWLAQQLTQLGQSIAQDEQRQAALLALQQNAARVQQQVQAAHEANQLSHQQLVDQQKALASDQEHLQQAFAGLANVLPGDTLERLRAQPAVIFLQLDQQIGERLAHLDQQREELTEQQQRQQAIDKLQDRQQHQLEQLQELQRQCAELDTQHALAQSQLAQWLGEHDSAEDWQRQLDQAVAQARQQEAQAGQHVQEAQHEAVQLGADLKAREERQQALAGEQQALDRQIAAWREAHADLGDHDLARLLVVDEPQLAQWREQVQHSDKAVEQARVLLQEREQRLGEHQAQQTVAVDAERLDDALLECNGQLAATERLCAELNARQADDQRRQDANRALATLTAQAYDEWQRWARLSALIGSASGDTFRKIAQAYNLDLLVHHANVQLRQLVRRYRLKRGGSMLGLLVLDTEMGDELRSVHSLSGGETFLVSLALALGLASMASSTLKIESLFIDEGFGSLDPESLQLAMDALDGLQAQGRKVAVISHVQEMHERIPVQIQVKRLGNGLSTVQVIG